MNFTKDTLKPIKFESISYRYDVNPLLEPIKITPQPEPYKKTKILRSPELSFNPSYNEIHEKIAEGNLQNSVKEAYSNIDYVPISTGYRGYSALSSNSRKIGVKQSFREVKRSLSLSLSSPTSAKPQEKVAEILIKKEPKSPLTIFTEQQFPAFSTKAKPGDSSPDSIRRSPITTNILDSPIKSDYGSDIYNALVKERKSKRSSSGSGSGSDIGGQIFDAIMKQRAKK